MIRSLFIKNFILVGQAEVEFGTGLNIITGETGAGKSIVINALAQLCGERASPDLVKSGAKKAIVEAQISIQPSEDIKKVAEELNIIDDLPELIIRKEISTSGSFRIFINDSPVNLSHLNLLSTLLFDIHGQHQHQRLLHTKYHADYLDDFGNHAEVKNNFSTCYRLYVEEVKKRDELITKQSEELRMHDLHNFQWDELEQAQLDKEEVDLQKEELKILSNMEYLHEDSAQVSDILYSGEQNASQMLVDVEERLSRICSIDKQFTELLENLKSARVAIEEIGRFTEHYVNTIEYNAERAEYLRQRLTHLDFLLKKYQQQNVQGLINYKNELRTRLDNTENFDKRVDDCNKRISELSKELYETGKKLTYMRIESAKDFEKGISISLRELGMTSAQFKVRIEPNAQGTIEYNTNGKKILAKEDGFDSVYFEVALNNSNSFRPLHKTASGGEISRIMLGLKTVLAEKDQIPVLIFDEIDSGISGKVAQVVGRKLAGLARYHQILCVTHLPQIAAFADAHYKVTKNVENGHSVVHLKILRQTERETEVAHLMGGEQISQHALKNARHLLAEADSQKK
jgi:DNA repair protein RecN (Recombination protein N)